MKENADEDEEERLRHVQLGSDVNQRKAGAAPAARPTSATTVEKEPFNQLITLGHVHQWRRKGHFGSIPRLGQISAWLSPRTSRRAAANDTAPLRRSPRSAACRSLGADFRQRLRQINLSKPGNQEFELWYRRNT